ncbi:hypothetical protein KFL_001620030 [Klebsormidium nitens]|uniref:Uncharacterized protein n=1 Tax=Klebsormidium nitens TaxID=105231 RepID=A0A1Y1HYS5_KLENI|nr:hypothetical protein KFL_001620030 [Klebsormidium nitens]|eukprot:GAQ83785.1 hypothetical protein KFL_001620030 [Klebsormidium nitens]
MENGTSNSWLAHVALFIPAVPQPHPCKFQPLKNAAFGSWLKSSGCASITLTRGLHPQGSQLSIHLKGQLLVAFEVKGAEKEVARFCLYMATARYARVRFQWFEKAFVKQLFVSSASGLKSVFSAYFVCQKDCALLSDCRKRSRLLEDFEGDLLQRPFAARADGNSHEAGISSQSAVNSNSGSPQKLAQV